MNNIMITLNQRQDCITLLYVLNKEVNRIQSNTKKYSIKMNLHRIICLKNLIKHNVYKMDCINTTLIKRYKLDLKKTFIKNFYNYLINTRVYNENSSFIIHN